MIVKAIHGSVRAMPRLQADLQESQESTRVLVVRYDLTPETVPKWRKHTNTVDMLIGARQCQSAMLSAAEEARMGFFRTYR